MNKRKLSYLALGFITLGTTCFGMDSAQNNQLFITFETASNQGTRKRMEDFFVSEVGIDHTKTAGGIPFFGIYDGHGGSTSAAYASEHLHKKIIESNHFQLGNIEQAIKKGYEFIDDYCCKNFQDGTTAVTMTVEGKTLWIANVGDSEAILSKKDNEVIILTEKHWPGNVKEKNRILDCQDGTIKATTLAGVQILKKDYIEILKDPSKKFTQLLTTKFLDDSGSVHKRFNPLYRVLSSKEGNQRGLTLSRTIGDALYKPFCPADPSIQSIFIKEACFVILASNGFWNALSHQAAGNIAWEWFKQKKSINGVAQELIDTALKINPHDNITITIVLFCPVYKNYCN